MIDCPNAEMRDRLPELAMERLGPHERVALVAHVAECAACAAEFALLRECRRVLGRSVRVDSARVARAVAAQTLHGGTARRTPGSRAWAWSGWRAAAAVLVIAGGASLTTIYAIRGRRDAGSEHSSTLSSVPLENAIAGPSTLAKASASAAVQDATEHPTRPSAEAADTELSIGGGVSDLSEVELRALLDEMGKVDALPPAEPEPVIVRVTSAPPGDTE
ncbi:MAG TPA: hypothetical protein VJU87_06120 [Gemmatimonadaceae bacterium]|nr:hypothetical protein [Gemmatimonadaceae bacterium]